MLKPQQLREHLARLVPGLATEPDKLLVFIKNGRIRSTGGGSLSFEYQYTLNVVLLDYAGHSDAVFVPILAWLRANQLDLLQNADRQAQGFKFEAEHLNNNSADLSIELALTERVLVKQVPGGLDVRHPDEPADPHAGIERWQLFVKDELLGEWDAHPWTT
ncbi:phage tail protein [Chitinimonas koreensis]|uniref:phage tail protein n=1 Tax=Chitinimonas koreensis TaxID=356302 RepID=UPI0005567BEB|nr:phage tail protein [Chitinimonas koreensis]QNM96387.1 phage tail protein [Chitinimonas koreensis]